MLENHHTLPKEFGTPLRKRFMVREQTQEDEKCSQGRSSITKSSYSPSIIDSPLLRPQAQGLYFDIDLCTVLLEDEDLGDRCSDFHDKGYCKNGSQCEEMHKEVGQTRKKGRFVKLQNFPELVLTLPMCRARSFME